MSDKKLYAYYEEDHSMGTLLLTDEQAAVFKYIEDRGYNIKITKLGAEAPYEIDPEVWLNK